MDDVFIYSDNQYSGIGMKYLIEEVMPYSHKKVSLFLFEKSWPTQAELALLLETAEDYIVLFCQNHDIYLLVKDITSAVVFYYRYNMDIDEVKKNLTFILAAPPSLPENGASQVSKRRSLSAVEYRVAVLYAKGISLTAIAKMLNKSVKTISAQKKSGMLKMEASTTIGFIRRIESRLYEPR